MNFVQALQAFLRIRDALASLLQMWSMNKMCFYSLSLNKSDVVLSTFLTNEEEEYDSFLQSQMVMQITSLLVYYCVMDVNLQV